MGLVSGSLGKTTKTTKPIKPTKEEKTEITKDGLVVIHRKRKCPKCEAHAARVQKTVNGKPVLKCDKCGEFSYCEYAK